MERITYSNIDKMVKRAKRTKRIRVKRPQAGPGSIIADIYKGKAGDYTGD